MKQTKANEVLENGILDQTIEVIEKKGRKVTTINRPLKDFRITDEDGDGYNVIDILREGEEVDAALEKTKGQAAIFAKHLMLLAGTCPTVDTFRSLLEVAEKSIRWGKTTKGMSEKERNMYRPAPQTYQTYKYRICKAWEQGIIPGKEYEVEKAIPKHQQKDDGKTTKKVMVKADSPTVMLSIANKKAAKKKDLDIVPEPTKPDGTQILHMDLGQLIGEVTALYDTATDDGKIIVHNTLENLAKNLVKHQVEQDTPAGKKVA